MVRIVNAKSSNLFDILSLQKIAYQSEAELNNDYSIPPLLETLEQLQEEFERGIVLIAIDETSDMIVGSVRGYTIGNTLYIGKLIVKPECQNKGIGKQLLKSIEDNFPEYRYELFTSDKSIKNIALYERTGYRQFKTEQINEKIKFIYFEK